MATGQGTSIINFGAFPGAQEASVAFTDAAVVATSKVEAYVMADGVTADHSVNDHRYLPLFIALTAVGGAGAGTIHARAPHALIGQYQLRYVWAD